MGRINILPEHVANRIAAGEVIERPASVVKELIENAIDAGATRISVEITHGGKSLIRVRDNGCGMDHEDARLCLVRHATSKIATADDISHITTMGFRGEALPSIAAVSRLRLITRPPDAATATLITVHGGTIDMVGETVAEQGTTVEVADLFFNTPARKKFLRSEAAEYNAVAEVFDTLALSRSTIAFCLTRNNVRAADYPATDSLLERITQIYGSAIADRMYPVSQSTPILRLHGFIGTPDISRVNRTGQKIFINGRPVHAFGLSIALSRAYEEFLERGRFPYAFLFFDIAEEDVDVNVHPAKREVRLRHERTVIEQVIAVIKQALSSGLHGTERSGAHIPSVMPAAVHNAPSFDAGAVLAAYERSAAWRLPSQPYMFEPLSFIKNAVQPDTKESAQVDYVTAAIKRESLFDRLTVLGQVLQTYILALSDDGIMIIDQHAAHERIIYEDLLAAAVHRRPAAQALMFPATLHLTLQEAQIMETCHAEFQALGFNISSLGGRTMVIDAVPACMSGIDAPALLRDCLNEIAAEGFMRSFTSRQEAIAALLACKTHAIKAGKLLSLDDMQALVTQLGKQANPHVCPHGRPIYFTITRQEIERRLKRT
ncbi:MAG: DNA mismatch repair endonuclease MutL [Desulfobacterota bacterium]|nr:DNA mismatch repair endonuclease MutL [Thermodesulfobacteriota bacterium]